MSTPILAAAARLEAVLMQENAALLLLDVPASAALHQEKLEASSALAALAVTASGPESAAAALRLRTLAQENRQLLERAMQVQGHIVEMVARAARRARPATPRYGARGLMSQDGGATALLTQA